MASCSPYEIHLLWILSIKFVGDHRPNITPVAIINSNSLNIVLNVYRKTINTNKQEKQKNKKQKTGTKNRYTSTMLSRISNPHGTPWRLGDVKTEKSYISHPPQVGTKPYSTLVVHPK